MNKLLYADPTGRSHNDEINDALKQLVSGAEDSPVRDKYADVKSVGGQTVSVYTQLINQPRRLETRSNGGGK